MTNEETIRELQWMRDNGYDADDSIIGTDRCKEAFDMAIEALEKQGKKGKWKMGFDGATCSACGRTFFIAIEHGLMPAKPWFYYCPNCGADMRGE